MCARGDFTNADPPMGIREASEADATAIVSVTNLAFAIETFLEGLRTDERRVTEMMRQGTFLVAAKHGKRIIASVYVETRNAPDATGRRGYFGMLGVDPMWQGKGYGAQMVRAAERYCRERGCQALDIAVLSLGPELLPFYHRLGYRETGTEEFRPLRPLKPGACCYSILLSKDL